MENFRVIFMYPTVSGGSLVIAEDCEDALKKLPYEFRVIDPWKYKKAIEILKERGKIGEDLDVSAKELSYKRLMELTREFKPHLFFTIFGLYISPHILSFLKRNNVKTACWFVDDPYGFEKGRKIAKLFDFFFTHEPTIIEKYKEFGIKNVFYLPIGCNPNIHKRVKLTSEELRRYECDLSFVGVKHPNRVKFLEELAGNYNLKIWGNGWEEVGSADLKKCIQGGNIPQKEMVKVFNASKIVINLHPTYGLPSEGVSNRVFIASACGAFQLVDEKRDLSRFFKIGEEIVCFRKRVEVPKLIDYYLINHREREEIAARAQRRVYKDHTYMQRLEEMFRYVMEN
jgi:spore maturation protein CgeB